MIADCLDKDYRNAMPRASVKSQDLLTSFPVFSLLRFLRNRSQAQITGKILL